MLVIVVVCCFLIKVTSLTSECESATSIWTYYPCSFIISSSACSSHSSIISSSIDQCINKEITFFWHFPTGNMTLTLESDANKPFRLRLSETSSQKKKTIENIYHLVNDSNPQEKLLTIDNEIMIHSDKHYQCSIKFQTSNRQIFDYGTFIRMTILSVDADEH